MKAVDIVLIPPNNLIDYALELNSRLESRELILSRKKAMPHISLAMAVIDPNNEKELASKLATLAPKYQNIELEIDHVFYSQTDNELVSGIGIKRSNHLIDLHQDAITLLKPYALAVDENDKSVFANNDQINYPQAAHWPLNYLSKYSRNNFDPHITIGFGDIKAVEKQSFQAQSLSLYHLGPYCTCNSLIANFNLQ